MFKLIILVLILCTTSFSSFAQGDRAHSGGGGNGGDYIRMKFIEMGNFVLANYKINLKKIEQQVSVQELRATLDINVIHVSEFPLYDNRGNPVDAIGSYQSITLFIGSEVKNTGWYGLFKRGDMVEKLVLHEMLRAAGVNDDNYIYSSVLEINGPLESDLFQVHDDDEKTYFEKLGDRFKTGTRPNLSRISNIAWAGRCFSKDEQNESTNAGYIFIQKRTSDAGPIAANSKSYEAYSYWNPDKAPDFYDKTSLEEIVARSPNMAELARDAILKSSSIEISRGEAMKSNLKVSGKYLVEEISEPDGDASPVGKVIVGERCYYFIPDLNE